jgi:AraC-like DNA-binding protein
LAVSDRDAVTEALKALTALAVSLSGAAEPPASAEPQAVRRARRNLLADLGGRQTLQSLAGRVGMSPFHLQRLFAQTTGLSPRQQHMLARLRQVRRLLLDDMAISEIAVACGFSDQSHLNRVFARLMGIPPGRYRTQLQMHDRNILDAAVRPPSHP